jgi:hypothetical protein
MSFEHWSGGIHLAAHHFMMLRQRRESVIVQRLRMRIRVNGNVGVVRVVVRIPTILKWRRVELLKGRALERFDHDIKEWPVKKPLDLELGCILLGYAYFRPW